MPNIFLSIKNWIASKLRNHKQEFYNELHRSYIYMTAMPVGTPQYEAAQKIYLSYLDRYMESRKIEEAVRKVIIGAAASGALLFAYRRIFDLTGDPFFKDIGKSIVQMKHI